MNSLTKKFKSEYSEFETEVKIENIELKGIAYNVENGDLACLVDNNDERASFNDIEVAYVDEKRLVGFIEITKWEDDDILQGTFEE